MSLYLPIHADVKGRRCVVLGGDEAACNKARILQSFGAEVVAVATAFCDEFLELDGVERICADPAEADLDRAFLVIVATGDETVDQKIFERVDGDDRLVNTVDRPALCNFIFPSMLRRDDFLISVSTGGASPALARLVRREIEELFGPEFGVVVERVAHYRKVAEEKICNPEVRREAAYRLAQLALNARQASIEELDAHLRAVLDEAETKDSE